MKVWVSSICHERLLLRNRPAIAIFSRFSEVRRSVGRSLLSLQIRCQQSRDWDCSAHSPSFLFTMWSSHFMDRS